MVLRQTGQLIGICGFAPCLGPYGQLLAPARTDEDPAADLHSMEIGLYWAVSRAPRRRGFATEGARGLIDFAFGRLRLARIVATTTFENAASIGVMGKLGMRIEHNRHPNPPWFQVVGVLDHPSLRAVPTDRAPT